MKSDISKMVNIALVDKKLHGRMDENIQPSGTLT